MKEFLSRLVCSIWLLLFSGVVVFAVPTEKSIRSPLTFGYDERTHGGIAYDRALPIAFNYDSAWRLVADEKENRTARHGCLLADFAGLVAANSAGRGPVIIGETMKRVGAAAEGIPGAKILNEMPKFTGTVDQVTIQMMQYNRKWILEQMRSADQSSPTFQSNRNETGYFGPPRCQL